MESSQEEDCEEACQNAWLSEIFDNHQLPLQNAEHDLEAAQ
jgi:hypothetical protein